jgi:TonB family protein
VILHLSAFSCLARRDRARTAPACLALGLSLIPALAGAQANDGVRAAEPAAAARSEEVVVWRAAARDRIRNQWIVPSDAAGAARVELEVALLPSGYAADVSTRRSSGSADFDSAARRAVLAAMPLPLPSDAAAYERLRRFGAVFESNGGVQLVDVQGLAAAALPLAAAAPAPAERFVCSTAGLAPPAAPDCSQSGSRTALLTCFAQAVQKRAARLVGACAGSAYPVEARRNRWEGTVQVAIAFAPGGKPAGVSVAQTSGQALLDQRAIEIVQAALVPPPAELYATPFAVRVPMVFRMQRAEVK